MLHLGDITKISGYTAPVVDCIIGGSPCQDLSVAGKRAGLDGERSGLYMEQIRIVKEMRKQDERNGRADDDIRPRYMVWENVPGAFSSNKGEDFRIVLEELAKVKDPNAVIPMPPNEKWTTCGCIMGDGWSIAWRVFDAQFWGVPQRRRRIALVADFGGQSAPEILFVRKSVSRDIEPSEPKRKETSSYASRSPGADDRLGADQYNAVILGDTVSTLGVNCGMSHGRQCVLEPQEVVCFEPGIASRESRMGTGGGNVPMVMQQCFSKSKRAQSATDHETWVESDKANTLNAFDVGDVRTTEAVVCGFDAYNQSITGDKAKTLNSVATDTDHIPSVVYALDRASFNQGKNAQFDFEVSDKGVNSPLVAKGPGAVAYCIGNGQVHDAVNPEKELCKTLNCMHDTMNVCVVGTRYIVRRLTPLECERLQGYPDGWTQIGKIVGYDRQIDEITGEEFVQAIYEYIDDNGKKRKTSDAARYKALGNSIAHPPWKWVLKRLCACYERDATMASLFDGIGGFPYLWEQLNGKGTCLWASEMEE
ncbi:MAG: DNA cytosine methyltransferase, partial [Ruminococcaceae bacterium]|nr:DNA cytosine methyltransferase [Oscillospiraceae bacterium]